MSRKDKCKYCEHLYRSDIEQFHLHVENKTLCRDMIRTDKCRVKDASEELDLLCFEFGAQLG